MMLCVACGWVLAAVVPAATVSPALAYSPRMVRLGVAPPLPIGARVLGSLAPSSKLNVTVALAPRDPAALAAFATAVSTPGSSLYRAYITPREFARRFGPTEAQISAVEGSLQAHGLNPSPVSANGLSIHVAASAAALDRAFQVSLTRLGLVGRATAVVNRVAPALDAGIAHLVQGVIGLNGLASPRPLFARATGRPVRAAVAHARPHVVTGGPQPCGTARVAAVNQSAYTADQIASAYGFSNVYQAGNQGQGQTIALYELEPNDPSDIAAFQSCYGTQTSISYLPVDGGVGSGAGSGEAALDIEAVLAFAPKARLLVYQAPNSGSNSPGAGPYDEFSAIVSQDLAKVVSASWGQCESVEGSANAAAEGTLFEEAAVQGQTIVSASGDNGSEDCYTGGLLAGTELAVDDPASQPFVTGVGGTTLASPGPRPAETVWNAGGSLLTAMLPTTSGAGGGGVSSLWRMPGYQSGAPSFLNVLRGSTSSGCGPGSGFCREVPDVSAIADPSAGYLIYWNGTDSAAGQPAGWQTIGGTSLSAPLWAALIALVNAAPACGGAPLGFVNPALYGAAASGYANDFNDVQSGNNDFTGTHQSTYSAGAGYDMASGLGSPNASALAGALCAHTLRLVTLAARSSTVSKTVSLQARTTGGGSGLRFAARGLPAGVSIDAATGRISGTPRKIGRSTVTLSASDGGGAFATTSFAWTVGGPPTVSHPSVTGAGRKAPVLRLTLRSGRGAPPLEELAIALPRGVRFAGGARSVALAGRVPFTAKVAHGILTVTPTAAATRVALTVDLAGAVTAGQVERLTLTATDALENTTRVPVRVKPSG
jgi:subtilase family serine protease